MIKGTTTAFVGDFANFAVGCSFVLPASMIYHAHKSRKTALVGMSAQACSTALRWAPVGEKGRAA